MRHVLRNLKNVVKSIVYFCRIRLNVALVMLHCPVVVAVVLQSAGSVTADLAYVGKRLPDGIQLVLLFRQQLSDLRKGSVLRVILLCEDIFDIIKG